MRIEGIPKHWKSWNTAKKIHGSKKYLSKILLIKVKTLTL